ncbi:phage tail spike protein [Bacillus cereus]|uniref:phage tail spike protein n=1 Tax=Bacillus cereus TaxID=1396 RepID=UPI002B24E5D1|nr:phage tail spike protein [Bacillus cereus]MEB2585279.1 phage tail spike protein [Bacillus cereus]MEB2614053.1 phage tail spike protein [Bacillus cereus]
MRTTSGILHIVDFKTSQIVSNIQPKDYWDDKRHWEIKNNIDTLEFKVFDNTEVAATLMQQNLVLKEVRDGRIVPYVITEAEKNSDDRSVIAYASGEWIQLAKDGIINPQKIVGKTVNEFIDMALVGTKWKRGKTEYAGFHTMTIDEFIDPLKFLKDIASLFELEIQYRAEVVGSQIVGRYVDMVKKRGHDTGKEVTLGKDLMGIKRIENSQNICTALLGFVKKEGGDFITISSINNGVPYLVDNDAFQRWNERGQHKFGFYTPETEQDITPQRLMTLMKTEIKKRVNSSVSYEVNAQSIGRVFGLAHELINEGDIIRIKDTGFTPKLYLEARAIAGDESFTDPSQDKYVFGDYREITDPNEEMRKLYNRVLASLGNKANKELLEQLEKLAKEAKGTAEQAQKESKAAKDIAEKTKDYMDQNLVDIIEGANPPTTGLKPNKTLWRDISNGKPGVLKIWTGTAWEPVVPDTGPLQQSIKDVKKDIETAKTELNQKVQEAQNQATGQFNEVKESLQGVSRTISSIENKQGEIDKKVTQVEQDSNGFKTSIESLTKKETEISNKLNTVEQTVEGTKKTISDVQQTTNDLKKTTTEIKEQAGKISEKLTSVEKNFNEQEIGVRNLISDTKYWETTQISSSSAYGVFKNNLNQIFSELAGETVTFSFDVKIITTDKTAGRVQFYGENGSPKYTFVRQIFTGITDQFQRVTYTTKITEQLNNTGQARLEFWGIDAKTTKIIIQNLKLEKGNKATGWTPAPEDQVTTDEFTKKTTEIEKSVDGVKTTVSTVQKDQGAMQTTLNQVKQTTDSNSQTITTLSQTQGKQGEIIQQNTSDITQLNNQIKSKVTDTQMQEYVGGLGSTNLLFNTAFEDRVINATTGVVTSRKPSISKWSVGPNGSNFTAVPETARNHDGMNSVKLESSGQTVDRNAAFYQSLPVSPNSGDYVVSAWFYTDAVATIDNTAFVMIEFYNGSTWVTNKVIQLVPLLTNGSWKFVSVTMPAPASGVTTIRFVVVIRKNGRLWVSQPQLQQGITPSSFMENPKDYANYDQLVGEIAKKVATADFDSKVSKMETTINQQSNRIDLKAEKTDVYTKTEANGQFGSKAMVEKHESSISLMSDQITNRVQKGDIISSINQTAEKITIDVSKLAINADTMVQWLTAKGIDTNIIKVNGDKITIDKTGVTVKMLDFLFEDEWGTKTTVMPKRNLIADHDFSSVPKLNIGNPNYQGFGAGYGLPWKVQGNGVVIENNTFIFNYEQMVNAVRVDTYNYPETKVQNGIHPGNSYTLSAHYRTAQVNGVRVTAKPRLQVCFVTPLDEVSYKIWHEIYKDFPEPSTFYGDIRRYNFTFTVPNNYNPQEHMIVIKITAANAQVSAGRAVCVSGITLVSGNYACMYNWDRTAAERADGIQPFRRIALGDANTNIGISDDGYTVDFTTNKEFKFFTNIRAVQGVNMGGNQFQGWGHIRFADGNLGPGFYVSTPNGWKFNALG